VYFTDPPQRRQLRTLLSKKAGRRNLVNAEHRDEVAFFRPRRGER
jgi:hypothetical protein